MPIPIRRVVTGHDDKGKAVVRIDEIAKNGKSHRPGSHGTVIWTTDGYPVNNDGNEDAATRKVGTNLANGTVFRVSQYEPGVAPRNHRSESIDYALVIAGEIDMELDETTVHLKAGDVLVQRGTIHNWVNRGNEACVIAFILIGAHPVNIGKEPLKAVN